MFLTETANLHFSCKTPQVVSICKKAFIRTAFPLKSHIYLLIRYWLSAYADNCLFGILHSSGGHAKTLMFAHVSPEGDSFGETISTLKFAQRVSTVELGAARANKESSEIMQLKEQVNILTGS